MMPLMPRDHERHGGSRYFPLVGNPAANPRRIIHRRHQRHRSSPHCGKFLQQIAPYLPLYRAAHLVWNSVGVAEDDISRDWVYLAAYTVAFFLLALYAYRRDQSHKFN